MILDTTAIPEMHRSHNNARSVLEMGSSVSVVNSAALMQKYEIGLYLLTAARALIVVL